MACVQNILSGNVDSEMEEGEIVDDLDDLSDISSEEEFLLRQRLQVLENYNNVLERKKTKNSVSESDKRLHENENLSHDLSEISDTDINYSQVELKKRQKPKNSSKHKKRKEEMSLLKNKATKATKKKPHRVKKKIAIKIISESSEESEDEYRNKRRKLANAVSVTKQKNDTSSLKARITKMLCSSQILQTENEEIKADSIVNWCIDSLENSKNSNVKKSDLPNEHLDLQAEICELIDLCGDDSDKKVDDVPLVDCVDSACVENQKVEENLLVQEDSEEDLELLRQHALKTKANKSNIVSKKSEIKQSTFSEDEDSDTAELRAICLKSALLKKAIELKRKQKLKKRLSQSFQDEITLDSKQLINDVGADNNTDIESVDMDIGSDGDERSKEAFIEQTVEVENNILVDASNISKSMAGIEKHKEDENEEDEDLLRAKLLISLSKNLSNLVSPTVDNNTALKSSKQSSLDTKEVSKTVPLPKQKPFIIQLGESDSEGESEAAKNLTKMHMKWSEQTEFQQKLDMFLKSTRMEVENQAVPNVNSKPPQQNISTPKFVAKNVKYLPKSEQIEYKNLVKRMEELEKLKQARQLSVISNKSSIQSKDTLKPRNVTVNTINNSSINDLEQQIATSRKKIAEESSKMLKLKEEGIKLSQRHKIVATELRNITTAITLNKKEQRLIHNRLSKIRHQHQLLLNRSPSLKHSINNSSLNHINGKNVAPTKLQKENNPAKEEYKNPAILKSVKVSVANDYKEEPLKRLSIELEVTSSKKIVKVSKPTKDVIVDVPILNGDENPRDSINSQPNVEKCEGTICDKAKDINNAENGIGSKDIGDYKSPLEALQRDTWTEDPNTFLCPFEVGGTCKDPDCKYLHPKVPPVQ